MDVTCIPLYIYPEESIQFTQCTVFPGVTLKEAKGSIRERVSEADAKLPAHVRLGFTPSHLIYIELQKHFSFIEKALKSEGHSVETGPLDKQIGRATLHVEDASITKNVAMSLFLVGSVQFRLGGYYRFSRQLIGRSKTYVGKSCSPTAHGVGNFGSAIAINASGRPISATSLRRKAKQIFRYYRSYRWWNDRLGVSLGHCWNAICASEADHGYVGLCMALEALLSTSRSEITHKLAERVAVLLGNDAKARDELYKRAKHLYRIRSDLVHGAAAESMKKKSRITLSSLHISAKSTIVPHADQKSLVDLVIDVLNKLLEDTFYQKVLLSAKNENDADKQFNQYFNSRLFGNTS